MSGPERTHSSQFEEGIKQHELDACRKGLEAGQPTPIPPPKDPFSGNILGEGASFSRVVLAGETSGWLTEAMVRQWLSPGGVPIHTGWMADGMWVAITLDNVAEAHLARGSGDAAARYLYATLNHGTPLYTWCDECGQEPGTSKRSGDRQHLWTPVAVVRAIRDSLVWEEGDGLRLALGTDRSWLAGGKPVGIADAPTHFGRLSYQLQYDSAKAQVTGRVQFPENATAAWAELLVRLPSGLRLTAVNPDSGAALLPAGQGLRWESPRKTFEFVAQVGN